MTAYEHRFGGRDGGGIELLVEDPTDWKSAGQRRCWGAPDDYTCHSDARLARCEDVHSDCGGGDLLLHGAMVSPQPAIMLRDLIALDSRFELAHDGKSIAIYDCSGTVRRVALPWRTAFALQNNDLARVGEVLR